MVRLIKAPRCVLQGAAVVLLERVVPVFGRGFLQEMSQIGLETFDHFA